MVTRYITSLYSYNILCVYNFGKPLCHNELEITIFSVPYIVAGWIESLPGVVLLDFEMSRFGATERTERGDCTLSECISISFSCYTWMADSGVGLELMKIFAQDQIGRVDKVRIKNASKFPFFFLLDKIINLHCHKFISRFSSLSPMSSALLLSSFAVRLWKRVTDV